MGGPQDGHPGHKSVLRQKQPVHLLVVVNRASRLIFAFPSPSKKAVGVSRKLLELVPIFGGAVNSARTATEISTPPWPRIRACTPHPAANPRARPCRRSSPLRGGSRRDRIPSHAKSRGLAPRLRYWMTTPPACSRRTTGTQPRTQDRTRTTPTLRRSTASKTGLRRRPQPQGRRSTATPRVPADRPDLGPRTSRTVRLRRELTPGSGSRCPPKLAFRTLA